MLNLPSSFLALANMAGAAMGAPFYAGQIISHAPAIEDDGGTIITPGSPVYRPCRIQIDVATEAMRRTEEFADGDARFIILAASLAGGIDTDAEVEVLAGPHVGTWMVSAIDRDPAAVGYVGRGRRA